MNSASHPTGDFWAGVDLAQKTLQSASAALGLDVSTWQRLAQASCAHTPAGLAEFAAWIRRREAQTGGRCLGIVVEATGGLSRRFAEGLASHGLPPVSIVNPAYVKAFGKSLGQRSKNDTLDAAVLAVFGAVHQPAPTPPRSPAQERLLELDRLRQNLVEQQTAWKNSLREARDPDARLVIEQQLELLGRQIKQLNAKIGQTVADDPQLREHARLLDSVPGIGPCLAATLLAELGDLRLYERDELVGYAGMFSRERRTGQRQKRGGGLVKGGGARVRRALSLAAMALMRSKSRLKEIDLRLQARGKSKLCALGALMRKLLLIARAVTKSGKPYDPVEALRAQPKKQPACG